MNAYRGVDTTHATEAETQCIINCYRCCVGAASKESDKCKQFDNYKDGKNCRCEKDAAE